MASGRLWPFNDRGGDLFRLVTSLGAKHEDYATHDRSSQYRSPLPLPQFASRYFILRTFLPGVHLPALRPPRLLLMWGVRRSDESAEDGHVNVRVPGLCNTHAIDRCDVRYWLSVHPRWVVQCLENLTDSAWYKRTYLPSLLLVRYDSV